MTIELTKEEAEMLENYLFKKQINLENSNLTDAKCYRLILSIRKKLSKAMQAKSSKIKASRFFVYSFHP